MIAAVPTMATATSKASTAAAVAALIVTLASGCGAPHGRGQEPAAAVSKGPAFASFRAGAAPVGWKMFGLPDGTAALSVPPEAEPAQSDPGSVTAEVHSPSGELLLYFNATPKQGDETVAAWPEFRLDHLADENGSPAKQLSSRVGMAFLGGTGSCVEDTYTTRVGHDYHELACFVEGASGGSVLVVAAPPQVWDRYSPLVQQAVDAYVVR
ncbi:hypothetical protein [Sinomonas albida]|uniref:hypothetical protein n=1 Tax=Sinomonas albida TaxID=369942 RepID=UPI003019BCCC